MLVHAPFAAYTFTHLSQWHCSHIQVGQIVTLEHRCQVNVGLDGQLQMPNAISFAGSLCDEAAVPPWYHIFFNPVTSVDKNVPR